MIDTIASVLGILMFVGTMVRYVLRHREKLEDWYFVLSYQLTKPFKPPPKTTATLTVHVAGRIRSRRNPYTGEYITSRVDFDKD
jgi:hypothetical protein